MFESCSRGERQFYLGQNREEIEYNPLDKYQEWLIRMIRDSNLIAQYEGLNTLHMYLQCAPDVKNATMSTLPDLLDKINNSKNNFKEITCKIIDMMFEKEMGVHIVPELLKRFKTARNTRITEFSIQLVEMMIMKDKYMSIFNLKHIFNGIAHTLANHNKSIRDAGLQLLKEIYMRVDDDANSIVKKLKTLRPVLKNEIKSTLSELDKLEWSEDYRIFPKVAQKATNDEDTLAQNADKHVDEDVKVVDISQDVPSREIDDSKVDLITLVSDGFDKLPYVTQIVEK